MDFYCAAHKLVVEVDGDSHIGREAQDQARTDYLEARGCRVIRFTNRQVMNNLSAVLEAIADQIPHGT